MRRVYARESHLGRGDFFEPGGKHSARNRSVDFVVFDYYVANLGAAAPSKRSASTTNLPRALGITNGFKKGFQDFLHHEKNSPHHAHNGWCQIFCVNGSFMVSRSAVSVVVSQPGGMRSS
jgi:hypothetical protein